MSQYGVAVQISLFLLVTAVAGQNPLVSDGTCYFAANKQANSAYIPCGNSAFGVYACCLEGDNCLSSNACYNAKYGDTYLAGCTDPSYQNGNCPYKGMYSSNQWVSLVRCFVSNDTSSNNELWAPCNEPSQPLVSKPSGGCVCNAAANTAVFTDNPSLTNHAVLPANTGLSISWAPGYTPAADLKATSSSTTPSSTTTTTTSSSSSSSRSSSTSTSTSTSSSSSSSSSTSSSSSSTTSSSSSSSTTGAGAQATSTTGAEAGIGVGIGLGVLGLCALAFLLYRRRNKKRQQVGPQDPAYAAVPHTSPYTDDKVAWTQPTNTQATPRPDMRNAAWGGYKPELSGENSTASHSNRTSVPISEMGHPESPTSWSQNNTMGGQGQRPMGQDGYGSTGHTRMSGVSNSNSNSGSGSGSAGAWDSHGVSLMSNWTHNQNLNVRDPRQQHPTIHELDGYNH